MGAFECVGDCKISPTESTEVFSINMASNTTLNQTRRDAESQSTGGYEGRSIWVSMACDIPLILLVLAVIGLFEYGIIPFHKSGFYCNDPALSFPFKGDTISGNVLIISVLLLPIIMVFLTEFVFLDTEFEFRSRLRLTIKNTILVYRTYMIGYIMNTTIVEIMKGLMGNPRPVFFDLCEPDTGKTCNGSEYVSDFTCTSTKYSTWTIMDSYRSFPSGHTSMSVYCGLFIAWYLQCRAFNWRNLAVFLVPLLQILCLTYAAIFSHTRITDHRHHWWDVLVGFVIGVGTVLYAAVISSNFTYFTYSKASDLKPEQSQKTLLYDERRPVTAP
ncbi:unnamed protein product [Chrysodeixis includens]|uniref:Phosphatidic acid phosphatase type 2/haloperoxidase domain-containing protein n=1 Tax=Chrysodeixis includens TaxID=689277 RepID=A0A9N8L309_CHRIL|nr:unnamed protein product [Chrysodeixis includens]